MSELINTEAFLDTLNYVAAGFLMSTMAVLAIVSMALLIVVINNSVHECVESLGRKFKRQQALVPASQY